MNYIFGILIAVVSIFLSVLHLKQSFANYYDFVGIVVVVGGSLAVSCVALPWRNRPALFAALRVLVRDTPISLAQVARDALALVRGGEAAKTILSPGLPGQVLRDGAELMELGLKTDEIETILRERMYQHVDTRQSVANAFRGLAKYPPAFGLLGTVLGLVSLMRAVSSGAGSDEVGVRMAVALVATLYGLVFANIIINPAGEAMAQSALAEAKAAEISLQGVLLAAEQSSVLVAQEMLNSYLPKAQRLNVINGADSAPADAGRMAA